MISKPLFKQSCKANGTMWMIITFAVCFMLACVMTIAGNGDLRSTKVAISNTIIQGELKSQTEQRALNYYEISNASLTYFDSQFLAQLESIKNSDEFKNIYSSSGEEAAKNYLIATAYSNATSSLQAYALQIASQKGYEADSTEAQEILGAIMYIFNPMTETTSTDGKYKFDGFYTSLDEKAPRYDFATLASTSSDTLASEEFKAERKQYISDYAFDNSSIFLAGNMIESSNIQKVLDALSSYGVTESDYEQFGYKDYANVKKIATSVLIDYTANLEYRLKNMQEGETVDGIKAELTKSFTSSMLSTLPTEVSSALEDIGNMDLYGILVGSVFFKIAGLLLPIIYLIMASNNLISGQVDSGSMAYILSTPTNRKKVVATQSLFLIGSLLLMFVFTTITGLVCLSIVNVQSTLTYGKLILINFGAFVVMFAMSGISFLASSWFNRSKRAMGIGGGLNIFFLVATILGLFGSPIIPSVIRMESLNFFNYVSIISLFDVVSILDGTLAFVWKGAILAVLGIICYILAFRKFETKDLPL